MEDLKSVGFIGLGLMGVPMVENVISKTKEGTRVYVNDVVHAPVKQLCEKYPQRVEQCATAREVADKAVCKTFLHFAHSGT